jgi:hypothetical protein
MGDLAERVRLRLSHLIDQQSDSDFDLIAELWTEVESLQVGLEGVNMLRTELGVAVTRLEAEVKLLRAIVADLAECDMGSFDWLKSYFAELVERARGAVCPEAVAGSATPTGDDDGS